MQKYLTTDEAAKYLKVSKSHIYRLVSDKIIAVHKVGKRNFFLLKDLEDYIEVGRIESKFATEKQASKYVEKHMDNVFS